MTVLRAEGLVKSYRGRRVVDDVAVYVEPGEVVGLLGPNGSGKTTCFYMIIGIIRADHGNITINDEDITKLTMYQRAYRWRAMTEPITYIPFPRLLAATCVGFMANNVLPLRLGEFVRA